MVSHDTQISVFCMNPYSLILVQCSRINQEYYSVVLAVEVSLEVLFPFFYVLLHLSFKSCLIRFRQLTLFFLFLDTVLK